MNYCLICHVFLALALKARCVRICDLVRCVNLGLVLIFLRKGRWLRYFNCTCVFLFLHVYFCPYYNGAFSRCQWLVCNLCFCLSSLFYIRCFSERFVVTRENDPSPFFDIKGHCFMKNYHTCKRDVIKLGIVYFLRRTFVLHVPDLTY